MRRTNDENEGSNPMRLERVAQSSRPKRRRRRRRKARELDPPYQGPRPLVTFPILLGTPLPGQSRRPRGTPRPPSSTPRSLFSFSPPREGRGLFSTRVKLGPSILHAIISLFLFSFSFSSWFLLRYRDVGNVAVALISCRF